MAHEYYAVDLPGKMLYKKEFTTQIRKITPIEQKFIASLSQKEQDPTREYYELIKSLIKFDNLDMTFEELFWYDVQYLLYRLRFVTYPSHPIKLFFPCGEDGEHEATHVLDIGGLSISTPDDIPDFATTITLQNLGKVSIRNKTVYDDLRVSEFAKSKNIDAEDMQLRLLLLDLCLISENHSLAELFEMANDGTITAEDILNIEKWFTNSVWGVKEEVLVKCQTCQKEVSREYYLALDEFFSAV